MKKIYFVLFSAVMAVSSFAQERVILDRDTISINGDSATLVRTKDTPNKIKITMQVPMGDSVCENWQTCLL